MGRMNSKSSSATNTRCKKKSAHTFGGLNLPCVTTVILPTCHRPQINHSLASVTGLSRRRRSQVFVADQQLDSASPGPRFLTDTFRQLFCNPLTDQVCCTCTTAACQHQTIPRDRQKPLKLHLLYVSELKQHLQREVPPPHPDCTAYSSKTFPTACATAKCPQSFPNCLFSTRCLPSSSSANAPQAALILSITTGVALQLFWGISGPRRAGKE